jgi:hypothetical protein
LFTNTDKRRLAARQSMSGKPGGCAGIGLIYFSSLKYKLRGKNVFNYYGLYLGVTDDLNKHFL